MLDIVNFTEFSDPVFSSLNSEILSNFGFKGVFNKKPKGFITVKEGSKLSKFPWQPHAIKSTLIDCKILALTHYQYINQERRKIEEYKKSLDKRLELLEYLDQEEINELPSDSGASVANLLIRYNTFVGDPQVFEPIVSVFLPGKAEVFCLENPTVVINNIEYRTSVVKENTCFDSVGLKIV